VLLDREEGLRDVGERRADAVVGIRQNDVAVRHAREHEGLPTRTGEGPGRDWAHRQARLHATVLGRERPTGAQRAARGFLVGGLRVVPSTVEAGVRRRRIGGEGVVDVPVPEAGLVEADDECAGAVDAVGRGLEVSARRRRERGARREQEQKCRRGDGYEDTPHGGSPFEWKNPVAYEGQLRPRSRRLGRATRMPDPVAGSCERADPSCTVPASLLDLQRTAYTIGRPAPSKELGPLPDGLSDPPITRDLPCKVNELIDAFLAGYRFGARPALRG